MRGERMAPERFPKTAAIRFTDRFVWVYAMAYGGLSIADPDSFSVVFDAPIETGAAVGQAARSAIAASRRVDADAVDAVVSGAGFGGFQDRQADLMSRYKFSSLIRLNKATKELWIRKDEHGLSLRPTTRKGGGWSGLDHLVINDDNLTDTEMSALLLAQMAKCQ